METRSVKRTLSVDLSGVRKMRRLDNWTDQDSSSEDESIYSIQQHDTEVAKDTSDCDSSMTEYEVNHTINSIKNPLLSSDESDEVNEIAELGAVVAAVSANLGDIDMGQLADTSTEQSTSPTSNSDADPELPRQDYLDFWTCIQCKAVNENRHVPFCAACYTFRKTFYAERPRRQRRRLIGRALSFPSANQSAISVGRSSSEPNLDDVDVVDGPIRGSQNIATVKSSTDSGFESQETPAQEPSKTENSEKVTNPTEKSDENLKPNESKNSEAPAESIAGPSRASNPANPGPSTKNVTYIIGDNAQEVVTFAETGLGSSSAKKFQTCQICDSRPANSGFIHKHTCHWDFACYDCARKVWRNSAQCPLCRSKISNVVRLM